MFDQLLNLVKEHAGDAIVNNPAIPNEKNDAAISSTATSIVDALKSQVASGGVGGIMEMFKGGAAGVNSSSMASNVQSTVVTNLMKQFGIDNAAAAGIASSMIPKVMESFVKKTNDPNDKSFDVASIVSSLGGAQAGGILSKLAGFFK